jgi:hypothetical protein
MKHAIQQDFRLSGDEPIEVLAFIRVFKEADDHKELPAPFITYFLTGISKEGYRDHLCEATLSITTYPFMVQYSLETMRSTTSSRELIWRPLQRNKRRMKENEI